jgi:hypothetical protein
VSGAVIEFPSAGARAIECQQCGRRFEGTTPKRTALAFRAHRCGQTEPLDWMNDDEFSGTVAVHLRLTPLEVNHMLAWLEHPTAPRPISEIGTKVREQITSRDRGHIRDGVLLAVCTAVALAVCAIAVALP